MTKSAKRVAFTFLFVFAFMLLTPSAALAQDATGGGSTLHYFGAAIGSGLVTIGAGYGISRFTSAAVESIARQPSAAKDITGAFTLPLFLLEGVAVIGLVVCLLAIVTK